jgi:hypothetical protein
LNARRRKSCPGSVHDLREAAGSAESRGGGAAVRLAHLVPDGDVCHRVLPDRRVNFEVFGDQHVDDLIVTVQLRRIEQDEIQTHPVRPGVGDDVRVLQARGDISGAVDGLVGVDPELVVFNGHEVMLLAVRKYCSRRS